MLVWILIIGVAVIFGLISYIADDTFGFAALTGALCGAILYFFVMFLFVKPDYTYHYDKYELAEVPSKGTPCLLVTDEYKYRIALNGKDYIRSLQLRKDDKVRIYYRKGNKGYFIKQWREIANTTYNKFCGCWIMENQMFLKMKIVLPLDNLK